MTPRNNYHNIHPIAELARFTSKAKNTHFATHFRLLRKCNMLDMPRNDEGGGVGGS